MESLQEEEEARDVERRSNNNAEPEKTAWGMIQAGGRAAGWASDVTIRERVTEINGPALLIGSALSLSLSRSRQRRSGEEIDQHHRKHRTP